MTRSDARTQPLEKLSSMLYPQTVEVLPLVILTSMSKSFVSKTHILATRFCYAFYPSLFNDVSISTDLHSLKECQRLHQSTWEDQSPLIGTVLICFHSLFPYFSQVTSCHYNYFLDALRPCQVLLRRRICSYIFEILYTFSKISSPTGKVPLGRLFTYLAVTDALLSQRLKFYISSVLCIT